MAAITFDTLSTAKNLEDAGVERSHAEAIAVAIQSGQGEFATKSDLKSELEATKSEIKVEIKEMKSDIEKLKTDINWLKWLYGIQIALSVSIIFKLML